MISLQLSHLIQRPSGIRTLVSFTLTSGSFLNQATAILSGNCFATVADPPDRVKAWAAGCGRLMPGLSEGGPDSLGGRADALRIARDECPVKALPVLQPSGDQVDVKMRN